MVSAVCNRGQFHQHFISRSFYARRSQKRKKYSQAVSLFSLLGSEDVGALPHKMLVKLIPGLDFINVLRTAFTPVVPQSVRTQSNRQYLFTLLGPTSVKAVRRTLVKLTPGICPTFFIPNRRNNSFLRRRKISNLFCVQ